MIQDVFFDELVLLTDLKYKGEPEKRKHDKSIRFKKRIRYIRLLVIVVKTGQLLLW